MIFQRMIAVIVEKRFFKTLGKIIEIVFSWIVVNLFMRLFIAVDNNAVFFTNFSGQLECNPGYICKEMIKEKSGHKIYFSVLKKDNLSFSDQFPIEVNCVKRCSYEYYKALCSAKVIVDNGTSFIAARYIKKKSQVLIQTWHGSLGIKRFPMDVSFKNKRYNRRAHRGASQVNYLISNSNFENSYYRETYWPKTPILMLGHARNDILFSENQSEISNIRKRINELYSIKSDTKICLYAPTFRDGESISQFNMDYEAVVNALEKRFGGNYVVFTRFHFRSRKTTKNMWLSRHVRNVSDYPDIQELMACCDVGITDYSSWICEFIHTGKPGFLYATDYEHYRDKERGFYDPLDKMPFPLSINSEELVNNIINFDEAKYKTDIKDFLRKKGCIDDGHASKRICELIDNIMEGNDI